MADPAYVQSNFSGNAADTTRVATLTPTAGRVLVGTICHSATSAAGVTFSLADDQGNTWERVVRLHTGTAQTVEIWRAVNVAGAATNVTATASASCTFELGLIEASGVSNSDPVATFGSDSNGSGTSHNHATAGNIDTSVATLIISAMACGGGHGGVTPTTSFTELLDNGRRYVQYRAIGTGVTDERCNVTTVSSVTSVGCVVAFKGDAAAASRGWLLRSRLLRSILTRGGVS